MATFIIDAGHGPDTKGKHCYKAFDVNETKEYILNARIADYVVSLLDEHGHSAVRVDDFKSDVPLKDRVAIANKYNALAYISIHHNADPDTDDNDGINDAASGITVFHYPTEEDKIKATRLYNLLIAETGLVGNRALPVAPTRDLYVIRNTKMRAVLIENGFMDNEGDVQKILTRSHARATARAIVQWCLELADNIKLDDRCLCDCDCCVENCK